MAGRGQESIHGDDEMGEVDALSGDHSISSSFTSGSALGTGAFLPVGKAHQMTGLDEWVAEAASQRNLPVPQGKQRLDDLLSESEHYAVKNPEEIQIHPVRTSTLLCHYIVRRMTCRYSALASFAGAPPGF